jgi:hypothetical protein
VGSDGIGRFHALRRNTHYSRHHLAAFHHSQARVFREGRSEKHLRDIRGMLAVTDVDQQLLDKEIAERELTEEWGRVG